MENPLLENWSITYNGFNYINPDSQNARITGEVFNNKNHRNGEIVTTSPIKKFENGFAFTRNTCYALGKPSISYKKWAEENRINLKGLYNDDF